MNILSMSCTSCGAPLKIPDNIDQLYCAHCGTALIVQRSEGYAALKVAEHLGKAIQESSNKTQAAIVEGTQVTQAELKRLQLTQELSAAHMQLGNIQAQIRSLQLVKQTKKVKRQLAGLRGSETNAMNHINMLQAALRPIDMTGGESVKNIPVASQKRPKKPFTRSPFKMGCAVFFLVSLIGVSIVIAITSVAQLAESYVTAGNNIVMVVALIVGVYYGFRVAKKEKASSNTLGTIDNTSKGEQEIENTNK
jgi:uncharacterized Zn finger protein (UPF0148 family)